MSFLGALVADPKRPFHKWFLAMTEIRYHSVGKAFDSPERAQQSIGRVLEEFGFEALGSIAADTSYRRASGAPIQVALDASKEVTQILVHGVNEEVFQDYGSDLIREMLIALSECLGASLGRTYEDSLLTVVRRTELSDGVDALHWFQYFGPALASSLLAKLRTAPVLRWATTETGAAWFTLAATPFDEMMSRRAAADALGIHLRPIPAKDMNGDPIQLNWG